MRYCNIIKILLFICLSSSFIHAYVEKRVKVVDQYCQSYLTEQQLLETIETELEFQDANSVSIIATCVGLGAIPIAVLLFILHECYCRRNGDSEHEEGVELEAQ